MNQPATILLVDDEPFNIDFLEQELEELGYLTQSAANGQEALARVAGSAPDLILLDIMMPLVDGFTVLATLKGDKATRHIPIIVISALGDLGSIVKAIQLGAEDFLPKPFDDTLLRARISSSLEKKRLRDQEQLYLQALARELEIGRQIQVSFLPDSLPVVPGWDMAAAFQAAREVSGDFYDAFWLRDGSVALILGDVCDKGVGAALYMTLFRSLLRVGASLDEYTDVPLEECRSRAKTLQQTMRLANDYVANIHGHTNMFATIFFGLLNPITGTLLYTNAGHQPPLLFNARGLKTSLSNTGPAAGLFSGVDFGIRQIQLEPGDTLLIVTDGVTEALNAADELFDFERLLSLVVGRSWPTAALLVEALQSSLVEFTGTTPQFDDITLLALQRQGDSL